jgi:hypothetical protein
MKHIVCTFLVFSAVDLFGITHPQTPARPSISEGGLRTRVTLAAEVERETAVPFTVTAIDANGNTVTSYTGTVHFTGTSGISLPADYTFTPADNGSHTFTAVFHLGGFHGITATDVIDPSTGASAGTHVICSDYHATASNSGAACPGQPVMLTATSDHSGVNFYWSGPHGWFSFQQNPTAPGGLYGQYFLTVTDPNNRCEAYAMTTVAPPAAPPPAIGSDHCPYAGSSYAAYIANWDQNGPYTNLQWSVSGGTITSGQGTRSITVEVPPSATSLELSVSGTQQSTGCLLTGQALEYVQQPGVILVSAADCPNAQSSAETASTFVSDVNWSITNGVILSDPHQRHITYTTGSSGYVTLTASYQEQGVGCRRIDVVNVPILTQPNATISTASSACPFQTGLTASVPALSVPAPTPGTQNYEWTISGGTITSGQGTRAITYAAGAGGSVELRATVSGGNCAVTGTASVPIGGSPQIVAQPRDATVQGGSSATLSVAASGGVLSYQWFEGGMLDTSKPVGSNSSSFTTPPLFKTTSYWVRIRSGGMCSGETASRTATVSIAGRRRAVGR